MAALEEVVGKEFENLSRGEKLFLIQMTAAHMYATEPEKVEEKVFPCVIFIHRQMTNSEQEELIVKLVESLQKD